MADMQDVVDAIKDLTTEIRKLTDATVTNAQAPGHAGQSFIEVLIRKLVSVESKMDLIPSEAKLEELSSAIYKVAKN